MAAMAAMAPLSAHPGSGSSTTRPPAAAAGWPRASEAGSASAPRAVTDQLDAIAVPVEPHIGVQAVDAAGIRQRHGVTGGLRRVDAIEPVGIGHPLRDELTEMEQHRAGGRIVRVGVGL